MSNYQVRSESSGIERFSNLSKAFEAAKIDKSIWKISWTTPESERIRLIRNDDNSWIYSPLMEEVEKELQK